MIQSSAIRRSHLTSVTNGVKVWRNLPSNASFHRCGRSNAAALGSQYDALIIGGGHNGLVAAAYLQRSGVKTAVLERRHLIGGAAVTEELIPGFKFSRASYVLSLLRPRIYQDLELKKHGLKVHLRDPSSFTPLLEDGVGGKPPRSLLLGTNTSENQRQISQFSAKDAQTYDQYEAVMSHFARAVEPLLDAVPVDIPSLTSRSLRRRLQTLHTLRPLVQTGLRLGKHIPQFYELLTAPMAKILDRWFESEPLKATLATDAVVGAMLSPRTPGRLEGVGGGLSGQDLADLSVRSIVVDSTGAANGVVLKDGTEIRSKVVLSNATPHVTFLQLTPQHCLPEDFIKDISSIDYTSPVTKINVAVDRLPNFTALADKGANMACCLSGTIHLNTEDMASIHQAYQDASAGRTSHRPLIEMCIPSVLDTTLAPTGCHIISMFTQYTPYWLPGGKEWDDEERQAYADRVFDCIEQYAPGFKASVVGRDILTPPDLEKVFGLTGGNIFHGAMSLDQLYFTRPSPSHADYRSPVRGLYLCGSGAHPGKGTGGGHSAHQACFSNR
uniref:Pyridine nucleotide-disulphide oxidoreductase domain 2 n=1 Tax=Callorhinchus milii TaxID=7868 RepID=A0A4W3HGZ5_CALMI